MTLDGFPEPFFGGSEQKARRWSRDDRTRLVRQEVVDLERTSDLGCPDLLMMRLPERCGSPRSIHGLREDLQLVLHEWVLW